MDINSIKKSCSNPSAYIKTKLKNNVIYMCRPQIGTEVKVDGRVIKTDNRNDIIIQTESGETFYKREDVMKMLIGYYYLYKRDGKEIEMYPLRKSGNGWEYNVKVLNALSTVVNNIPIIDWKELVPCKRIEDEVLWTTFVPARYCFDVLGVAPTKFTGAGMFIVCNTLYGAPDFKTRRIVNGVTFDTMYTRTRAFDEIPKSVDGEYKVEKPKSLTSINTILGASVTFRKYTENMLEDMTEHGYVARGYKYNFNGFIDIKYFILQNYGIKGIVALNKKRELVLEMWYKKDSIIKKSAPFSVDGFNSLKMAIKKGISIVSKEKNVKKYTEQYRETLRKYFKDWITHIGKVDKNHRIKFLDSSMNMTSPYTFEQKEFECFVKCKNKYFNGNIIGGIIAIENKSDNYRFVLTLIGDGVNTSTDYYESCTSKGLSNLDTILKETVLK